MFFATGAKAAYYDANKKFISYIENSGGFGDEYLGDIPENAKYIRISCYTNQKQNLNLRANTDIINESKKAKSKLVDFDSEISKLNQYVFTDESIEIPCEKIITDGGFTKIFRTVGVVGDSLSSGLMNYMKDGVMKSYHSYEDSWIQYMARYCGSTAYNFSQGGLSTRTFLHDVGGHLTEMMDGNHKCHAYFIALCHNDRDYYVENPMYIGNTSDVDLEDYTNNADTFCGNYGGIIQRIKSIQPDAKIFAICSKSSGKFADFNVAIRNVAGLFAENVYVIDMERYCNALYPWEETLSHGNAMGYLNYSYQISSYVDYIIRHNRDDFKMVQLIGKVDYDKGDES